MTLVCINDPSRADVFKIFGRVPWLRRLIARLLYISKQILNGVTNLYDNDFTKRMASKVSTDHRNELLLVTLFNLDSPVKIYAFYDKCSH